MSVTAFRDLPLADRDHDWDGDAAEKRVRKWADAQDEPNQKYRDAHVWFDGDNEDNFTAYKLLIADVVGGKLEAQVGDERVQVEAGGFLWVPRGRAHSFANAGPDQVHVLALALPGGAEELFAEQAAYLSSVQGPPDSAVLGEIGTRHGAPTLGPPIRSKDTPPEDGAGR